jgi:NhaA family Na+:H+ antiporter
MGPGEAAALDGLPPRRVSRLVERLQRFLRIEAMSGTVLLLAAAVALLAANSAWSEAYLGFWQTKVGLRVGGFEIAYSLQHIINDGLMTLFFFVVGLEIKRELAVGELRDPRTAALPLAAAAGGMVAPALIYLALQYGKPGEAGWGVVMATDIAFVVGCLAILGPRAPRSLRVFVLSLAIIDDIGAILVIALGYTAGVNLGALGFALVGIGAILGLRFLGVRGTPAYWVVGMFTWFAVHESGIHPTVAGVALGLLTPARAWIGARHFQAILERVGAFLSGQGGIGHGAGHGHAGPAEEMHRSLLFAARESRAPLERLEHGLHPWVSFLIMPVFALANAGVALSWGGFADPVAFAVALGLGLGKPVGIVAACRLAIRLGLARRPAELTWPVIAGAGVLSGIGFTMALFIAALAFQGALLDAAKLGILAASVLCAALGLVLLRAVLRDAPAAGMVGR